MSAPRGRTYLVQIDTIAQVFVTILEDGSLALEDAVTGDYVTVGLNDLDKFAASDPPYTEHIVERIRQELLDDTHDTCGWDWIEQPEGHWWYREGKCPNCTPSTPTSAASAAQSLLRAAKFTGSLGERSRHRLAWLCGADQVRSRPWLTMSWVAHQDRQPHLVVHEGPTGPALHFDSDAGPTFVSPEGVTQLTWREALQKPETWSATWGPADRGTQLTQKAAAYHALATLMCLGDFWQVVPARFVAEDEDPLSVASLEVRFHTAQEAMLEYLGLLAAQFEEGAATGHPEYWHEPMWVGLKDGQPFILVDEAGVLHTRGGDSELPKTPEEVEQLVRKVAAPKSTSAGSSPVRRAPEKALPNTRHPAQATTRTPEAVTPVRNDEGAVAHWASRVRGLMLGIALGDAIASIGSSRGIDAQLRAGAATELTAWTVEGLLRSFTACNWAIQSQNGEVIRAYQRWALLRGARSTRTGWDPLPLVDGSAGRGWLIDTPEMRSPHGSSPSMMNVAMTGLPTREASSRGLIKGLPYGALAGVGPFPCAGAEKVASYAGMLAGHTHTHPYVVGGGAVSTFFVVNMLRSSASPAESLFDSARSTPSILGISSLAGFPTAAIVEALDRGTEAPRRYADLNRFARGGDALGALLGGLYVAASVHDRDGADSALEFCSASTHARSVAAVTMALVGAAYGYDALPSALVNRLEFGWIMDRLATDLALRVATPNWRTSDDAAWKLKYPASPQAD